VFIHLIINYGTDVYLYLINYVAYAYSFILNYMVTDFE